MTQSKIDRFSIPSIEGRYSSQSFMVKMNPILTIIANDKKGPGRPCSVDTISRAKEALYMLLSQGNYHANNLNPARKLRQVLDKMTEGDYPILEIGGSRHTVYFVAKPWEPVRKGYERRVHINNDEGYDLGEFIKSIGF